MSTSRKPGDAGFPASLGDAFMLAKTRGMARDLVSVIIPVRDCAKYVARCLSSVVCQTYPFLEVLVVDDGSSDGTLGIAQAFAAGDSRVTVLRTERGGSGPAAARNLGLDSCHGRWVKFVDADDLLVTGAVGALVTMMSRWKAGMPMPYLDHVQFRGEGLSLPFQVSFRREVPAICPAIPWNVHRMLFDREAMGDLRFRDLRYAEDSIFVVEYLRKVPWSGRGFVSVGRPYLYQKSPKSLTRDNPEKAGNAGKAAEEIGRMLDQEGFQGRLREQLEAVRRVCVRVSGKRWYFGNGPVQTVV